MNWREGRGALATARGHWRRRRREGALATARGALATARGIGDGEGALATARA
ncbi:hypothetical protein IQ249_25460 [Lusitaniella coriacea LEGE 07157]|uniref:Uncharacterized protein n=1 Tax=Lusitaniella coriacea LEGE 07157 TaxID=945747 RepID=A0A8J7E3I3_9CYAN|nr:hypothetical protein [Lusitaniella coriacea]MBE9119201.1 hypothetical protein [Lusitaniella coriacea LEGE 07157]MBE9119202.1 hypothetical protein [Lusitaniella coriacea LEGE 07157]